MKTKSKNRLIVIVGPTSSGKTEFAIDLAQKINAEIVSADSRQIYNELSIGTGKPDTIQLNSVKHHMISTISITESITADKYAIQARKCFENILIKKPFCLLAGGTGLWIQAAVDGLTSLPEGNEKFRDDLKKTAENEGKQVLYQRLYDLDKETALNIGTGDQTRIIRALEIIYYSGKKRSTCYKENQIKQPIEAIWFGMDVNRKELYDRCELKIDQWLKDGWIDEVKEVVSKYPEYLNSPAFKAIGINTINEYINQNIDLQRCIEIIKRDTRRYIKRQLTWFKKNKRIIWIKPGEINLVLRHISLKNQ